MAAPDMGLIKAELPSVLKCLSEDAYPTLPSPESLKKRASVALIIRFKPKAKWWPKEDEKKYDSIEEFFEQDWVKHGEPEVVFIKRAARKGDKWTSHIALPGGKRDPDDPDDKAAAVREAWEEIGLDLNKYAIDVGNLPQRIVTTHWGKKPLLVLCPYVFLLTKHDVPPLKLQATEVAAIHWVPLRELLNPAQRTVAYEDVASRYANQETGVRVWATRMMIGRMRFAAINLAPSESLHTEDEAVESNRYDVPNRCYEICAFFTRATHWDIFNEFGHIPREGQLILWGLTLGVVSDFLDLFPPHNALTLWTYPTFTSPDVRFAIWLSTYRFKNRKRAELQAGTTIPSLTNTHHHRPSFGAVTESVVMSKLSEWDDQADETGLHGLGSGTPSHSGQHGKKSAVSTMLEGLVQFLVSSLLPEITDRARYYDILRKAVTAALVGRLGVVVTIAAVTFHRFNLKRFLNRDLLGGF
ncbi:hypothetical protein K431DRAFT_289087 [Polychaeton citri CBS 116435]|uniref:Nudix hydrolase domain-containing protein n=1 Tax=Polychaeton citri CBS 116435 TaxID=1314669 RepID=A0A9P4UKH8_9PEZI|nr:hypothetical protein K431DRAFT_289087 [Polychaeton citri CBS 116435]